MPILARATRLQVQESWRLNFQEWADDLSLDQYLAREQTQVDTYPDASFSQTNWVLLADSTSDDILSACETLVRPCVVSRVDTTGGGRQRSVVVGNGYGIASVYCRPEYRRRGYAGLMLTLLAQHLENEEGVLGGGLWSDIGPDYYARFGWATHPSRSVSIKIHAPTNHDSSRGDRVSGGWITRDQVAGICEADVEDITKEVAQVTPSDATIWSFLPTSEVMRWHHARMDYMYSLQSSSPIDTVGYRIDDSGFALWTLQFSKTDSILYILRIRYNSIQHLKVLLDAAVETAVKYSMKKIVIWDKSLREIKQALPTDLDVAEEEMRKGSISALHVNGTSSGQSIEWHNNQKFCWC